MHIYSLAVQHDFVCKLDLSYFLCTWSLWTRYSTFWEVYQWELSPDLSAFITMHFCTKPPCRDMKFKLINWGKCRNSPLKSAYPELMQKQEDGREVWGGKKRSFSSSTVSSTKVVQPYWKMKCASQIGGVKPSWHRGGGGGGGGGGGRCRLWGVQGWSLGVSLLLLAQR